MSMEIIGNREKKTYSGWILSMEAHQSFIRQHANVTDVLSQDGRIEVGFNFDITNQTIGRSNIKLT